MGVLMNRIRLIYASSLAAIAAIIFAVVITIAGEQSAGLTAALKGLTGHHWISKSILTVLVYFGVMLITYAAAPLPARERLRRNIYLVVATAIAGYIVLLLFFVYHYFAA